MQPKQTSADFFSSLFIAAYRYGIMLGGMAAASGILAINLSTKTSKF